MAVCCKRCTQHGEFADGHFAVCNTRSAATTCHTTAAAAALRILSGYYLLGDLKLLLSLPRGLYILAEICTWFGDLARRCKLQWHELAGVAVCRREHLTILTQSARRHPSAALTTAASPAHSNWQSWTLSGTKKTFSHRFSSTTAPTPQPACNAPAGLFPATSQRHLLEAALSVGANDLQFRR